LNAEQWYLENRVIMDAGSGILPYYNSSHITALIELDPELKLQKQTFLFSKSKWYPKARRRFLFNPLDSEKWYTVKHRTIEQFLIHDWQLILLLYFRNGAKSQCMLIFAFYESPF